MIPEEHIINWHANNKWQKLTMVEQDLILSRALICLFSHHKIKNSLAFRGGTALNKLYLKPAARYSEDIDLVQLRAEPIGDIMNLIRELLKEWLGEPAWKLTSRSAKLIYKYETIDGFYAKLKIEINTTEHFQVLPLCYEMFYIKSDWFDGNCEIVTYKLEELMATKLRALYQRRKGRDLFDLWFIFSKGLAGIEQTIDIFKKYCEHSNTPVSQLLFQKNMDIKRLNKDFTSDMLILLPLDIAWDFDEAFDFVCEKIISKI